jgi:hypothetical protein
MRDENFIRQELIEKFGKMKVDGKTIAESPYFGDYVRIGSLLSTGPREPLLKSAFRSLETEMIAHVSGVANYFSNNTKKAAKASDHFKKVETHYADKLETAAPDDSNYSKLLTMSLSEFEKEHGFLATEKPPNYAGFVYGNVFKEGLKKKQHWKDVGAGAKHGEFTHRLHWYILIRAGAIRDVTQMQEATIFASIEPWQKGTTNLWTSLFDLLADEISIDGDTDDFRSPENMNMWLVRDAEPDFCPVLRSFLRARMSKRATYYLPTYLAKKTNLTEKEVEAIVFPEKKGANASGRLVYSGSTPTISPYAG